MNVLSAIGTIIGLSLLIFICALIIYCLWYTVCTEEGKETDQPEEEGWIAKHFYDPPHLSVFTPDQNMIEPTPYSFKLQNGAKPNEVPHAVINPAVLQYQYPPGHVLEGTLMSQLDFNRTQDAGSREISNRPKIPGYSPLSNPGSGERPLMGKSSSAKNHVTFNLPDTPGRFSTNRKTNGHYKGPREGWFP